MPKFNDRIFGSNIDKSTVDIFNNLQQGSFKSEPLESNDLTFQDYLGDRTPFARMWAPVLISGSNRSEIVYNIVNDNRDDSYVEANEPVGDIVFKELTNNPLLKPKAGITQLSTKTEGSLGAIKNAIVSFVVHNKHDFETIFLPYFLKPGATVIVDYGWSNTNFKPYDVEAIISNKDLELSQFKNDIYGGVGKGPNGETLIKNSRGVYYYYPNNDRNENAIVKDDWKTPGILNDNFGVMDVIIGKVTNFDTTVNQQGSFVCSITLVSENASLLDSEVTEDNNLKFIFANKMEELIIKTITNATGKDNKTIGNAELEFYDRLSSSDRQKVRENFYESIEISQTATGKKNIGVIPQEAVQTGLFYQNVTDIAGGKRNDKDVLYISYGLFEDLFLNGIISENSISDERGMHDVHYNTIDTFVRWDFNLVERQKALLGANEELSLFLYPDNWQNSYNGKITEEEYKNQKSYSNQYELPVIPLRELFISVQLISKTFAQKQNVNDALVSIIESLNKDSYGIFKLKMGALNRSFSGITLQDVNLVPIIPEKEELFVFDVMTENSIVSNLDYKLGMPKGGLASMIAIGEKSDFEFFDDETTDNLNFLRILGPDKGKVHFKSLPIIKSKEGGDKPKEKSTYDFSQDKTNDVVAKMDIKLSSNTKDDWTKMVSSLLIKKGKTTENGVSSVNQDALVFQEDDDILPADSIRDYYGKLARLSTILGKSDTSVSPILPVQLTLTVHGNTYLNYGDIFSINFLPNHYQDKIYFQVVNVEQNVDTNWQTTYQTVMRLRPSKKGDIVNVKLQKPRLGNEYLKRLFKGKNTNNQKLMNAMKDAEPVHVDPDYMIAHKVYVAYDDKTIKLDDVSAKVGIYGDSRILPMEFGYPQSMQDVAFIFAFQKTISKYIKSAALTNKSTLVHVKKELEPELNMEYFNPQIDDILITTLIEDKDVLISYRNAVKEFFDKVKFINNMPDDDNVDQLLKKVITDKDLQDFFNKWFYNWTGPYDVRNVDRPYEVVNVGDVVKAGNIDEKFGCVMSSIGFMFASYNDGKFEKDKKRFVQVIDVTHIDGLTSQIPMIMLPDWFFGNSQTGVNDFCKDLDKNFANMIGLLKDIFAPGEEVIKTTGKGRDL